MFHALRAIAYSGLLTAAGAAALLAAPAAHAAPRSAAPSLTAELIVAKNAAARGGLDAWRKVQTMVWLGHIVSTHGAAPSLPFVLEQKRPNKTRFEMHALNQTTQRVFNGTQGWKLHPDHSNRPSVEPYSIEELRYAQSAPGLDGPLIDCAAKGNRVALEGVDDIEGHQTYRLSVTLPNSETDRVWVDAKTFLDVRYERPVDGPLAAGRSTSVTYSDYRDYDGLQLPSVIETGIGSGETPDRIMIERVVLNAPLDDQRFADPAAPHAHRLGQPMASTVSDLDSSRGPTLGDRR